MSQLNEAFESWFNGSVVVEGIEPKLVFHGTRERFDKFEYEYASTRTNDGAGRLGFYFSESRSVAKYFTDPDDEIIVEAYLSIKNPVVLTADEFETRYAELERHEAEWQLSCWERAGYDGIRIDAGGGMIDHDAVVWVAFDSSQIKIEDSIDASNRYGQRLHSRP